MDENRKKARWRRRRIIYNNDGDDIKEVKNHHDALWQVMTRTGGELSLDVLNARTAPLVGTQVDSHWYATCTSGLRFTHHTKLGGFTGNGIAQELVDQYGRDNLQIQTEFSHENDLEVFWSMRMNDTHDAHPPGYRAEYHGLAPFKQQHPQCIMGNPDDFEKYARGPKHSWTSLDFSYPEVREHIFELIHEVCQGYDVDGVELDFFRAPVFFPPSMEGLPVEEQQLEMMTDLVRRLAQMVDEVSRQRGRPLLLAARTPFTVEDARFIGLDIEKWLAEDLIDLVIAGGLPNWMMIESFREMVDLGHKHEVPVYPSIEWASWHHWAFLDLGAAEHRTYESWVKTVYGGHPNDLDKPCYITVWNSWPGTAATWRGAAMNFWNVGADGIYIFNAFHSTPRDRWLELGDPETLAGKDMIFGVDRFAGASRAEEVMQAELKQGVPMRTHFQVGADVKAANIAELRFRIHLWDLTDRDAVTVMLNDHTLDDLIPGAPAQTSTGGQWLECPLDPDRVERGENRVELLVQKRDESVQTPLILDAVQVHLHRR
jgi:hypothetical protein